MLFQPPELISIGHPELSLTVGIDNSRLDYVTHIHVHILEFPVELQVLLQIPNTNTWPITPGLFVVPVEMVKSIPTPGSPVFTNSQAGLAQWGHANLAQRKQFAGTA